MTDHLHETAAGARPAPFAAPDSALLAQALDVTEASVLLTAADGNTPILYANAAFERLTGYALDEVRGRNCRFLQCDETDREAVDELRSAVRERRPGRATLLNVRKDGERFWNDVLISPVRDAAGEVTAFVGVQIDVTAEREVTVQLRTAQDRYSRILETAHEGICVYDADQRLVYANESCAALLGRPAEDIVGRHALELIHPDSLPRIERGLRERPLGESDRYEAQLLRGDGSPVWVQVSTTPLTDSEEFAGALAMVIDIGERKRHEEQLLWLAARDPLTGLANRRSLTEELERRISRHDRYGEDCTLVVIDVDDFKLVNDAHGHQRGDELLVTIAGILTRELRETDLAARLGGDEFAIVLDGSEEETHDAVERVLEQATAAASAASAALSAGSVSLGELPGAAADRILATADAALYEAKDLGKARRVHHARERPSLLTWADEVRRVLDENRLVAYCQPIVALPGGERVSEELLVRYIDERGDAQPPAALLRAAERFGRVTEIDRWVIAQGALLAAAGRRVHVNVSARSVADPDLPAYVSCCLKGAGAEPSCMTLEVTETYAIADVAQAIRFATAIRELGCGLALDDFGTGFASFAALRHLPVDMIKIDMQFVHGLLDSAVDRSIVRASVALAQDLGLRTVAEGVENEATLEQLVALGLHAAQGFHLGRPAPCSGHGVAPTPA